MFLVKREYTVGVTLVVCSLLSVRADLENADYSDNDLLAEESSRAAAYAYAWPPPLQHHQQSHPLIYQSVGPFAHFGALPRQQFHGPNCGFATPHQHQFHHPHHFQHRPPPPSSSWHDHNNHFGDYSDYEDSSDERTPPPPPAPLPATRPSISTKPSVTMATNRVPQPTVAVPTTARTPTGASPAVVVPSIPPATATSTTTGGSSNVLPTAPSTLATPAVNIPAVTTSTDTTTEEPFLDIDLRFGGGNTLPNSNTNTNRSRNNNNNTRN